MTGGEILFQGESLLARSEAAMQRVRGRRIALIPQDPTAALNPLMTVGDHLLEVLGIHLGQHGGQARSQVVELLRSVGIPEPERRVKAYPHQLSGGMRQRVMVAMAIACRPALLIADEPTTALDVTIQAQILRLLADLQKELGIAMVLITHDLGVVARVAHRVAVMYAGEFVETGTAAAVFAAPRHPYTVGLMTSIPVPGRTPPGERLGAIPGTVPSLVGAIRGCAFRDRCAHARGICAEPVAPRVDGEHRWRCVLDPTAPVAA